MKGSDRWGERAGPRVELVVVALVVVAAVGVYLFYVESSGLESGVQAGEITAISTTGIPCGSPSMPATAKVAEGSALFANLTAGLCYNYIGGSSTVLTFARYNGTIAYPCGDAPAQAPAEEVRVNLNSSGAVISMSQVDPTQFDVQAEPCGRSPEVKIVSLQDVESTIPAVPQLNLTLSTPAGGAAVATLEAVLTLEGGSQTFVFGSVTPQNPLRPGSSTSSTEIVLPKLSFGSNEVYPLTISGTLVGGRTFSYIAHAQVSGVP